MSKAFPAPLTPSERVTLKRIKAANTVDPELAARVVNQAWARRSSTGLVLTEAGSEALLDLPARARSRSARTQPAR